MAPHRERGEQPLLDQAHEARGAEDGVDAVLGRATVRGAADEVDRQPLEPLVAEREPVAGRLADHRGVRAVAPVERAHVGLGAEALHLLVGDGGELDGAEAVDQPLERGKGHGHCRHRALHVGRAAAEEPPVTHLAAEAVAGVVPVERHGVEVPAEEDARAVEGARAGARVDVGPPGRHLHDLRRHAVTVEPRRERRRHRFLLPRHAGVARDAHQLGGERGGAEVAQARLDARPQRGIDRRLVGHARAFSRGRKR
jgi:hypothetical protein